MQEALFSCTIFNTAQLSVCVAAAAMAHTQPAPTRCTRKSCEIPPKTWFLMTAASKTQSFTDRSVSLQDPKRLEDKRLENMYIVPPSKIWIPEVFIQNLGSIKESSISTFLILVYYGVEVTS